MTHQRWHQLWSAAFRPLPQTMGEGRFAGLAGGCPMKRRERRAWRRSAGLQPALGKRTAGTVVRKPSLAPRKHGEKPVTKPAPHRPFMMSKSAGGDEALFSYRRLSRLRYKKAASSLPLHLKPMDACKVPHGPSHPGRLWSASRVLCGSPPPLFAGRPSLPPANRRTFAVQQSNHPVASPSS